ncbi:MAG: hypothetical protein QMD04_01240 [Anaerolineales bacterium]|nr:hypothetical protein [Anaerolineales bacterium]
MSVRTQNAWAFLCWFLVLAGLGAHIVVYIPKITNYPFPISWSESGRIFNAYQIYAPLLSGKNLSWPWLDPGRSILDGIVLLLPGTQIWMYRFWISLLMLAGNFTASVLVVGKVVSFASLRKEKLTKGLIWLLTFWGTLFLLQGPIYYHVLLGILPVLWFYNPKKPISTLIVIFISSLWEGLGRVNWFLMPAILAITLYLLTEPFAGKKLWQYIRWPFLWLVSGGIASGLVYGLFIKLTGHVIQFIDPNMHYPFFKYKLWPNNGSAIGLVLGITYICLPVAAIVVYFVWKYRKQLHWFRLLAIAGILAVLFAGSTLISLRAGGGYDFHNYDTFLLLIFLCSCFLGLGSVRLDSPQNHERCMLADFRVLAFIVLIPVLFAYSWLTPAPSYPIQLAQESLGEINLVIKDARQDDRPILFIDNRQLLIYRMIQDVDIFVPYEKTELMEMAMARNTIFRDQFWADIEDKRFSLIISETLKHWHQNRYAAPYWYENNIWIDYISSTILNFYTPVYTNSDLDVSIYAPK